jgi:hypothetical protein
MATITAHPIYLPVIFRFISDLLLSLSNPIPTEFVGAASCRDEVGRATACRAVALAKGAARQSEVGAVADPTFNAEMRVLRLI